MPLSGICKKPAAGFEDKASNSKIKERQKPIAHRILKTRIKTKAKAKDRGAILADQRQRRM